MSFHSFISRVSGQPPSYRLKSDYVFEKTLGAGTFGEVKRALHKPTGEEVAVKIILKKGLQGNDQMVQDELHMLQRLNHPHIVRFKDWFESRDKYYIVTQLATGGELFDRICDLGKFTEKDAVFTLRQILDALKYLHDLDIVHRDLKPENLLYLTPAQDSQMVLADFGIAKSLDSPNQKLTSRAGSFGYAAPEVLRGTGHGKPCDIWSLGVITYTILSGYSPFRSETIDEFLDEVSDPNFLVFHERYWHSISPQAKQFIASMLDTDPERRPTVDQLLKHEWIADEEVANATTDLLPNIRPGFNARQKLRKGIEAIRLRNKLASVVDEVHSDEEEGDGSEAYAHGETLCGSGEMLGVPRSGSGHRRSASASSTSGTLSSFQAVVSAAIRNKDIIEADDKEKGLK